MYPKDEQKETIRKMYLNKTGKLLGCALALGCVLSNQAALIDSFQKIGEDLGIMFQIQDDLLEITGDQVLIGKSKDSDLKNQKKTYVVVLGIKKAQDELAQIAYSVETAIKKLLIQPNEVLGVIESIKNRSH